MRKRILIPILVVVFIIFLSSIVSANINWFGEANADLNIGGGNGFIGYASNLNNIAETVNYSMCTISDSSFTPVATDFDGNGLTDILTFTGTRGELYSLDCDFLGELTLTDSINAMPILVNYDGDAYQEVVVVTSNTIERWEYNPDLSGFQQEDSIDYNSQLGISDLSFIACPRSSMELCIALKGNTDDSFVIDFDAGTITQNSNEFTRNVYNHGFTQGIVSGRTLGNTDWVLPFCNTQGGTTNELTCRLLNESGEYENLQTGNIASASFSVDNIYYHSVWFAKMGTINRIFANVVWDKLGTARHATIAFDQTLTQLHRTNVVGYDTVNTTSNWAVGDYNKDGTNDACYLENRSGAIKFICWDSNFLSQYAFQDVTGEINMTHSLVMADFDLNRSTLGLATEEGIFYLNGTDVEHYFSTGRTADYTAYRSGMVVTSGASGNPAYVYADGTSGFIIRNAELTSACGNDICEAFENAFSCPADCSVNVTAPLNETGAGCITNDDCESGLCEAGFCVLKAGNAECDSDDQCISGECTNGKCTNPNFWDLIDTAKTNAYGDDSNTNNFISMALMAFTFILIVWAGKNFASVLIGALVFIIIGVFFAVVGWLSPFIAFALILGALALGFIIAMFGSSTD